MPPHALTLTWEGPYTAHDSNPIINGAVANWINQVGFRDAGGWAFPSQGGLYIVESPAGRPIYAGMAKDDVYLRFDGRSKALQDFFLTAANELPNHQFWYADVTSYPGWQTRIWKAEHWLVRWLARWDALPANAPRRLQNIRLIDPYTVPTGGMSVEWTPTVAQPAPAYLDDATVPGYVGGVAPIVRYNHPHGSVVFP